MDDTVNWNQEIINQKNKIASRMLLLKKMLNQDKSQNVGLDDEIPYVAASGSDVAEASLIRKLIRTKLIQSTYDLEILRNDPNSPLHSVKTFDELNCRPELIKGVYAMGFNYPSKIQETALPTLLADPPQNMIAQSQSGTGKTAAFVLAMLSRVDPSKNYPQALCLCPTMELALQTGDVLTQLGQYCPEIKMRYVVRGRGRVSRVITEHILIGTPGKVLDWGIKLKYFDIKKISVFVLDEADVMISLQGHQDQSIRIHKHIEPKCQTMLFSATYDSSVMEFAECIVSKPIVIRLRREEETLENIKQYYMECKEVQEKYVALTNVYGAITVGQTIIFCRSRKSAAWLANQLRRDGHAVLLLSGELSVEERVSVFDRFRDCKEKVLITTNVCARGLDIEQVNVMVNFDLPLKMDHTPDFETYLHRIGRTGRFGKPGIAINMISNYEDRHTLSLIEKHFGRNIVKLNAENIEELEKIGQE